MKWKFNNDQFLRKKIKELKSIKKKEFKSKFDDLMHIITHYNLNVDQNFEIINFINKNLKLIHKDSNFKKMKILVLTNHFFEYFKDEIILNGFHRNLLLDLDFAEIDNYNISEIYKRKNIKKDHYDLILISIFPNYFDELKLDYFKFYTNIIKSVKNFSDKKIVITDIPSLSKNVFESNIINKLNDKINKFLKKNDCHLWGINKLIKRYGEEFIHDREFFFDNKIFFNPRNIKIISDNFCSIISHISFSSPRAIITDLDNTFWKGILGDDGIDKVDFSTGNSLTEPFNIYQNFLNNMYNKGIFINIASKNDYDYVKKAFLKRNFKIKFNNFTCKKINWNKKSENIYQIAKELNLSLDNILFIDDNNSERFEVLQSLKKIKVINFKNINDLITNIGDANYFGNTQKNKINRSKSVQILKKYQKDKSKFNNYNDFLKDLKMRCIESPFSEKNSERLSEMTYKTNQFNFTFKRYNKDEIKKIIKSNNLAFSYKLRDRFIDHGIIASINIQIHKNKSATLDSFVMSCRVFDKDLENFILLSIKKKLIKLNINKINTYFIRTDRNKRFYDFYKNFNFEKVKSTKNKDFYSARINSIDEKEHFISKVTS